MFIHYISWCNSGKQMNIHICNYFSACVTISSLKCSASLTTPKLYLVFRQKFTITASSAEKNFKSYLLCQNRTLSVLLECWSTVCGLNKPKVYALLRVALQGLVPQTLHACLSKLSHLTPHAALSISSLCTLCLPFICCKSKQLPSGNSPVAPRASFLLICGQPRHSRVWIVCIRLHCEVSIKLLLTFLTFFLYFYNNKTKWSTCTHQFLLWTPMEYCYNNCGT